MSFYNSEDIRLNNMMEDITDSMRKALEQIKICERDENSEYNTSRLKKDIERFLEDWE